MEKLNVYVGSVFAAAGGLFALIGAVMLAIQMASGAWLFNVEGGERTPLGAEFAGFFFTFGQLFMLIGCVIANSKPNRRGLLIYLVIGNGVMALGIMAVMILTAGFGTDWSLTWPPLVMGWMAMVALGVSLEYRRFTAVDEDTISERGA